MALKCDRCNSCTRVRAINNRLYRVCNLCQRFWLVTGYSKVEVTDEEERKKLIEASQNFIHKIE